MRLMIVDDYAAVRHLIRHLVATDDDEVCECASGDEAISRASDFRPDTVTLDIRMPGVCWIKTARTLRQAHPAARVFIVTSYDEPELRLAAEQAGAAGYVLKDDLITLQPRLAGAPAMLSAVRADTARGPAPAASGGETSALDGAAAAPPDRVRQLEMRLGELELYAGFVAHELRNPLLRLVCSTAAFRHDHLANLAPDGLRHLQSMEESVGLMQDRLDGLWQLVRADQGTLRQERVNTDALVGEAWVEVCSERDRRRVEFTLEPLPELWGDRGLLRLVFVNLLANAIKFSARRPRPCVRVAGGPVGSNALLCVRDNGVGFPPELAKYLFQPFRRLHSPQAFSGTGLGLALAHRIVTRHGGRLWAESTPDVGAAFHLLLPSSGDRPGTHHERPPGFSSSALD